MDTGDITTLANPDIVEQIRELVQGRERGPLAEGPKTSNSRRRALTQAGHGFAVRALVFDAYGTLFDPFAVRIRAEELFPGNGTALSQLWRAKQLEYSWLRTLMGATKISGKSPRMH